MLEGLQRFAGVLQLSPNNPVEKNRREIDYCFVYFWQCQVTNSYFTVLTFVGSDGKRKPSVEVAVFNLLFI